MQTPATHIFVPQSKPQVPQFRWSVLRFTHWLVLAHRSGVAPAQATHAPPVQRSFSASLQVLPQLPQLVRLLCVSTQSWPHRLEVGAMHRMHRLA